MGMSEYFFYVLVRIFFIPEKVYAFISSLIEIAKNQLNLASIFYPL